MGAFAEDEDEDTEGHGEDDEGDDGDGEQHFPESIPNMMATPAGNIKPGGDVDAAGASLTLQHDAADASGALAKKQKMTSGQSRPTSSPLSEMWRAFIVKLRVFGGPGH